jgi:serine/threonine protein kinase
MDLRPYGLNLTWTPQTEIRTIDPSVLIPAHIEHKHIFVIAGKKYAAKEKVNQGVFGIIYKVEHEGKYYACKVLREMKTATDFQAFLNEVMIHIILMQTSMGEKDGPYVPYLYKVAYDKALSKTYIITEWMKKTLRDDIIRHTKHENDAHLPMFISNVAHILGFFGKTLQFNHRDLHSANVMLGNNRITLIDFGYSCLRWEGVEFKGPSVYNAAQNPCYKEDRDIPFLLMELYMYYDEYISDALRKSLHKVLIARTGSSVCDLGLLCPEHGVAALEDRYEFLNAPATVIPEGIPKHVERQFKQFRLPVKQSNRWFTMFNRQTKKSKTKRQNTRKRTIPVKSISRNAVSEEGIVGPLK